MNSTGRIAHHSRLGKGGIVEVVGVVMVVVVDVTDVTGKSLVLSQPLQEVN